MVLRFDNAKTGAGYRYSVSPDRLGATVPAIETGLY